MRNKDGKGARSNNDIASFLHSPRNKKKVSFLGDGDPYGQGKVDTNQSRDGTNSTGR